MSFRGRHSSRFRRFDDFQRPKRQFHGNRGSPYKKHHPRVRDSSPVRGVSKDRFRRNFTTVHLEPNWEKEKEIPVQISGQIPTQNLLSPKSQITKGTIVRQDIKENTLEHFGTRKNKIKPRKEILYRELVRIGSPNEEVLSEEEKLSFIGDAEELYSGAGSPIEWSESHKEQECLDNFGKSFESRSGSPLICHRSVKDDDIQDSQERYFERRSRSRSRVRTKSFEDFNIVRPSQRSEHRISSRKSGARIRKFDERRSPLQGSDDGRSIEESLISIERQIIYEKRRNKMLERKLHEKRSESSIERFLDDCKRACNSPSKYRSNSFDRRDSLPRGYESSLSPAERPRIFEGLDRITIQRGRSFERSLSPYQNSGSCEMENEIFNSRDKLVNRSMSPVENARNYQRTEYYLAHDSERSKTTKRYQSNKKIDHDLLNEGMGFLNKHTRLGLSPISLAGSLEKRGFPENPGISEIRVNLSPISQTGSLEKTNKLQFQKKSPQNELELPPISLSGSIGKKEVSRDKSNEKSLTLTPISQSRSLSKTNISPSQRESEIMLDLSPISPQGSFEKREFQQNFESSIDSSRLKLSPISQAGSFEKEEPFEIHNKVESKMELSPISAAESLENKELSQRHSQSLEDRLQLSPISQAGSFEKNEFSQNDETYINNRLELSPISQPGSFEKREFSEDNVKALEKLSGLSPISQAGSFEKELDSINDLKNIERKDDKIERPNSTDSMQQFLAELERSCEASRSSKERSRSLSSERWRPSNEFIEQHKRRKCEDNRSKPYNVAPGYYDRNKKICHSDDKLKPLQVHPKHDRTISFGQLPFYQLSDDSSNSSIYDRSQRTYKQRKSQIKCEPSRQPERCYETKQFYNEKDDFQSKKNVSKGHSTFPNQNAPFHQDSQRSNYDTLFKLNSKGKHQQTEGSDNQQRNFPLYQTCGRPNQNLDIYREAEIPFQPKLSHQTYSTENLNPFSYQNKDIKTQDGLNYQVTESSNQHSLHQFSERSNLYQQSQRQNHMPHLEGLNSLNKFRLKRNDNSPLHQTMPNNFNQRKLYNADKDGAKFDQTNIRECVKNINVRVPDPVLVQRFKSIPPSPEELGKMFEGFVLYFGVRNNSELENNPLVVIQESFFKSDKFGTLHVEDLAPFQDLPNQPKHVCVLRWQGVMLARAEEFTREEAQRIAAISLINALAQTCYIVQSNYSYYCGGNQMPAFMIRTQEIEGMFKKVPREEIIKWITEKLNKMKTEGITSKNRSDYKAGPSILSHIFSYIDDFFKDKDTHCELIFCGKKNTVDYTENEQKMIARYLAECPDLQWRTLSGSKLCTYIAVSRRHSPQYLCNFLLPLREKHVRYSLIPPLGPRSQLLTADAQNGTNIRTLSGHNQVRPIQSEFHQATPHQFGTNQPIPNQTNQIYPVSNHPYPTEFNYSNPIGYQSGYNQSIPSQFESSQSGVYQPTHNQFGPTQTGYIQPDPIQFGPTQTGFIQPTLSQYGPAQSGFIQPVSSQFEPAQSGFIQPAPSQFEHSQSGFIQTTPNQFGPAQSGFNQPLPNQFIPIQSGFNQPMPSQF